MRHLLKGLALAGLMVGPLVAQAQDTKFSQLGQELPTPNTYRTASGAPGHQYWQQRADYNINVELDDKNQSIKGSESITYTNNSPDALKYLWVQLDQNIFEPNSMSNLTQTAELKKDMSLRAVEYMTREKFDGGFKIESVKDRSGKPLKYTINNTMMRVDLPTPLKPGQSFSFGIDWHHNINDQKALGGRSGYEYFPKDGNYLYEMAQWFPRMAVYDDVNGWQHKQFLGSGEFALPFGDYKVSITVPADHVVAGTGVLQNANQVLSSTQQKRMAEAAKSDKPVVIVTQEEATKAEKDHAQNKKTWVYKADNVRDFAWASSRKFIWDAMNVNVGGKNVLAMSYYPKEANPLWGQYSTEAVGHTLKTYSKRTIDYPYPVAISVHGPVGGMEYPMLSFNGYRPEEDGTYSERTKYGLISVIIHEVGHNFFPMIINSDERQWTWMDEGLNTFVQYLSEQEWERNYPSRRGEPQDIVEYMKSAKNTQVPIMTNSESVLQFGNNAYGKPATALNILRETVMGRELFDYAFKEYANRWAFKHPMPADFFRTMEDASGVDLDWFWRGWFYTTDHTDIAIDDVKWYTIDSQDPAFVNAQRREQLNQEPKTLSEQRNLKDIQKTLVELKPQLKDFYNSYDPLATTPAQQKQYQSFLAGLTPEQKKTLDSGLNFYEVGFKNLGGLVMPLIVRMEFEDGTDEVVNIPAEIWRYNNDEITKVFVTEKPVVSFTLDPQLQTADTDLENNFFPRRLAPSRFEIFKQNQDRRNPMQRERATSSTSNGSNNAGR
ncbi:peptidase M1-like protein [Pontibacter ummariensis]|uniref:Peptidase family M1 n=1 Tax=Pontibacter ummariensis TaxID=1610492 RepID=A0A239HRW2_9BACT|nr:M1 family metallopeptidase [Pontibacter ummariensis]PRY10359.1 peptidase M1-like protein [Pontibacter ummariensis]SNS83024.1 Peptidase family M1 [Pontibacter ummariensis]